MLQWLKGRTAETLIKVGQAKIDMFKEGKKADKIMDEQLGEKSSERIQRGTLTTLLGQFMRGLWAENPQSLAVWHEQEAKILRLNLKKGGKK